MIEIWKSKVQLLVLTCFVWVHLEATSSNLTCEIVLDEQNQSSYTCSSGNDSFKGIYFERKKGNGENLKKLFHLSNNLTNCQIEKEVKCVKRMKTFCEEYEVEKDELNTCPSSSNSSFDRIFFKQEQFDKYTSKLPSFHHSVKESCFSLLAPVGSDTYHFSDNFSNSMKKSTCFNVDNNDQQMSADYSYIKSVNVTHKKSYIIISVSHTEDLTNLNGGKKCHLKSWQIHVSVGDGSYQNNNFSISFQRLNKIERESQFDYLLDCSFKVREGVKRTGCEEKVRGNLYDCKNEGQYSVEKSQKYFHMDLWLKIFGLFCTFLQVAIICATIFQLIRMRKRKIRIMIQISICISVASFSLLTVIERLAIHHRYSCLVSAFLFNYFCVAIYSWMLLDIVLLSIRTSHNALLATNWSFLDSITLQLFLGWGIPVVATAPCFFQHNPINRLPCATKNCVGHFDAFIMCILMPISVLLSISLLLSLHISRMLFKISEKEPKVFKDSKIKKLSKVKKESKTQEDSSIQEIPKTQEDPSIQEILDIQEDPIIQEIHKTQEDPSIQEIPDVQEDPSIQGIPKTQEKPSIQEIPKIQEDPSIREDLKTQEDSKITKFSKTRKDPKVCSIRSIRASLKAFFLLIPASTSIFKFFFIIGFDQLMSPSFILISSICSVVQALAFFFIYCILPRRTS